MSATHSDGSPPPARPLPATTGKFLPPVTRRINHGKGHRYQIDGQDVQGVTTIISDGLPKKALIDWAARTTAGYAVDHWQELAEMPLSERLRVLEKCRWETTKAAAARGTDVHALALRLAAGETVDVPEPLEGLVDAYLRFIDEWQPAELLVETPVFHRRLMYAGTLDLIAEIDGAHVLLDWKTAQSGVWPETAVQLSAYARAEFYLDPGGQEHPLPPVDWAAAVWLRSDGYDVLPLDISERTFRLFQYAQQVAGFVNDRKERYVGEAEAPPEKAAA